MTRKRVLTVTPGNVTRLLSEEEAAQLTAEWLSTFDRGQSGAKDEQFLWHLFSGGRYPSTEGDLALKQYRAQTGTEFIVLSNDRKVAFLTDQLPDSTSLYDYYVFPPNLAWTMAFTHEAGWLGPYFARHPDPEALDRANEAAVRKVKEAELARKKGWASAPPNNSFKPNPLRYFVELCCWGVSSAHHRPVAGRLNSGVRPHA